MGYTADEIAAELAAAFPTAEGKLPASVVATELLRNQGNSPHGIRGPHAEQAIRKAKAVDCYDIGDQAIMSLVLSDVTIDRPYSMLLEVTQLKDRPAGIAHAWRLYNLPEGTTPTRAFGRLLEAFGMEISIADMRGRFLAVVVEPPSGPGISGLGAGHGALDIGAMMKRLPDGSTEWKWAYGLDRSAYDEATQRQRG